VKEGGNDESGDPASAPDRKSGALTAPWRTSERRMKLFDEVEPPALAVLTILAADDAARRSNNQRRWKEKRRRAGQRDRSATGAQRAKPEGEGRVRAYRSV
jgi:hypothetical protein